MTIEEAIQHCHEVAAKDCTDCGKEHEQLALWLTELKSRRIAAIKELERVKSPKTNGDRIRQMTDDELSAFLGGIADNCSYNTCDNCPMYGACVDVPLSRDKWIKQEVREDAGTDD